MVDVMIGIFVFVGVIAVTTLLFSGWAVYGVIRALSAGIGALFASPSPASSRPVLMGQNAGKNRCLRARCHADNPPDAAFCRRCGSSLRAAAASESLPPPTPRQQAFETPVTARTANRVAS